MRIAICGYGRMGQRIHVMALSQGFEVSAIIDPYSTLPGVTHKALDAAALQEADAVIDFSSPAGVVDNIIMYGRLGIPAVIGTTGWYDKLGMIKDVLSSERPSILYSGNFSIGVALTVKLAEYAAKLMDHFPSYDVSIHEVHHKMKADSPSGTALMLSDVLLDNMDRKKRIDTECQHSRREEDVIHISSERVGYVPGTHTITFDSEVDTITLTHTARSRDGFAEGAIKAASWLVKERKTGFFSFEDFVSYMLGEEI